MSSEKIENSHNNKPDSGSIGRTFKWCPETKTVQAVDPSKKDPNLMTIGPNDTKYFADRDRRM